MIASEAQRTDGAAPSRSFKDTTGRVWDLSLSVAAARRVRDRLQVDLLDEDLTKTLERVFADRILLCDVLFLIGDSNTEPAQRVSDETFGRAMSGDSIEEGGIALMNALRDFTPNPQARARVGKLIDSVIAAMEEVHRQADEQLDRALARMRANLAGNTPSPLPVSPASNPGDSR